MQKTLQGKTKYRKNFFFNSRVNDDSAEMSFSENIKIFFKNFKTTASKK